MRLKKNRGFILEQKDMFLFLDIWWKDTTKNFSIISYRKPWKESGNKPRISFYENGGRRRNGDWCFDATLTIGYIVINYTDFGLQRFKKGAE